MKKPVVVGIHKPNEKPKNLKRFSTVKEAEAWVAEQAKVDPVNVEQGHYYIDAPENMVNPKTQPKGR